MRKTATENEKIFVLCRASKLNLDDEFMKHRPKSRNERKLKNLLKKAIKSGLKDFYRPIYDPSFDKDHNICYIKNARPAIGESYNFWEEKAKQVCPERKSRLGTKKEYIAFIGILLKKLSKKIGVDKAWNYVANDSKILGHYYNSPNTNNIIEYTGSRKVFGFYDLGNTGKILSKDKKSSGFWTVSSWFICNSTKFPIAKLLQEYDCISIRPFDVGWIVFEK